MSKELNNLLSYLDDTNNPSSLKLKRLAEEYNQLKKISSVLNQSIKIDTWELMSLIYPEKFKFEQEKIGRIGLEDQNNK